MPCIAFRRLERAHFGMLAGWLAEPHVHRWWCHDVDPAGVERDFGPSADGLEPNQDWLALDDAGPFGLIQFCFWVDYPEYRDAVTPYVDIPDGAVSFDYLLAGADRIGRGLGPRMLTAFAERTWAAHPEATCVIVPVAAGNRRSWRALEKAGFRRIATGDLEPDNPVDPPEHHIHRLDRP